MQMQARELQRQAREAAEKAARMAAARRRRGWAPTLPRTSPAHRRWYRGWMTLWARSRSSGVQQTGRRGRDVGEGYSMRRGGYPEDRGAASAGAATSAAAEGFRGRRRRDRGRVSRGSPRHAHAQRSVFGAALRGLAKSARMSRLWCEQAPDCSPGGAHFGPRQRRRRGSLGGDAQGRALLRAPRQPGGFAAEHVSASRVSGNAPLLQRPPGSSPADASPASRGCWVSQTVRYETQAELLRCLRLCSCNSARRRCPPRRGRSTSPTLTLASFRDGVRSASPG